MLTKSHCGGNLFGGILCSSDLWAGFPRCKPRGISAVLFLSSSPLLSVQSKLWVHNENEGVGGFGLLFGAEPVGLWGFPHVMVLVALCGHMPTPFPQGRMCLECRVHHWDCPQDGWLPEMLIRLWAQRGSAPLDSSFATSSQVGQELWSWLCECQTLFLKQPKCTENLQELRVLRFAL